ncbi:MAG TPA: hypothetical protein VK506_09305 [Conexibacter sp.]|nr:hypothetical protein [Conexibacter sp.]
MRFLDTHQIVSVIDPVNGATAANNGDWISLKNWRRCAFVVLGAVGIAGEDLAITLRQAKDVSGTSAKDLVGIARVDVKNAVDIETIGTFTKVTQTESATYTNTDSGESQNLFVVEVDAEQLDVNNGFDCVTVNIADTGTTAKLIAVLGILSEPKGKANVSAITN